LRNERSRKIDRQLRLLSDHPALAVLANGSHGLDGTFEVIEGVASACSDQFETLVVLVSANFTGRIAELLSMAATDSGTYLWGSRNAPLLAISASSAKPLIDPARTPMTFAMRQFGR
jgi:hypothetical protein